MGLKQRLLATLPNNKWCGCDHGVEEEESYQFRVRANDANTEGHRFQIRRKRTCNNCENDVVTVVFEDYCEYNPERGTHTSDVSVSTRTRWWTTASSSMMRWRRCLSRCASPTR
jgi:hypothetical protein